MTKILVLTSILMGHVCLAASVSWTYRVIPEGEDSGASLFHVYGRLYSGYTTYALSDGNLAIYPDSGNIYLLQRDRNTTEMPVGNNYWIIAQYGEVLSVDTITETERIPMCDWYKTPLDGGALIENPEDFYLGVLITGDKAKDGIDRVAWFHASIDDEGTMTLLASDIGVNGEPVTVGAIPEPSSTVLALLGVAVVTLRRRRL